MKYLKTTVTYQQEGILPFNHFEIDSCIMVRRNADLHESNVTFNMQHVPFVCPYPHCSKHRKSSLSPCTEMIDHFLVQGTSFFFNTYNKKKVQKFVDSSVLILSCTANSEHFLKFWALPNKHRTQCKTSTNTIKHAQIRLQLWIKAVYENSYFSFCHLLLLPLQAQG